MTDATVRLYPPTNEVMHASDGEPTDATHASTGYKMCRICLETDAPDDDPLIAPCRCSGSMKWVHRKCLNEWRAQEQVPLAFTHCPQCKFQYRTELDEGEKTFKNIRLTLFVARDTIGLFLLVQAFLAGVAFVMHACDPSGVIVKLYPEKWAESKAALHFSVGPCTRCMALTHMFRIVHVRNPLIMCLIRTANRLRYDLHWQPRTPRLCRPLPLVHRQITGSGE